MHVGASRAQGAVAAALRQLRLVPSLKKMAEKFVQVIEADSVSALQPGDAGDQRKTSCK